MEKKFTFYARTIACSLLTITLLFLNSIATKTWAQVSCTNENVLFLETFSEGTIATSSPDILTSGLTYQETGPLQNEGIYRIINSSQQKPEWQRSGDHTGDLDGKM